jgi:hypothetical protein
MAYSVTPNRKFTTVFSRMARGWAAIDSLRQVAFAGMPHATAVVDARHRLLVDDMVSSGQLERFIIGIEDSEQLQKTAHWLSEKLTEQALKNASYSVDAASLVFAHTILDDALNSFLDITCEVAPPYWQHRVEKKTVELGMLKGRSWDDVLKMVIQKEIAAIGRNESLVKKSELLHAVCKPSTPPRNEYQFDSETLRQIDKLRQDIVHGDLLGREIAEIETRLAYLRDTWNYFFVMMHVSFGLQIDSAAISDTGKRP